MSFLFDVSFKGDLIDFTNQVLNDVILDKNKANGIKIRLKFKSIITACRGLSIYSELSFYKSNAVNNYFLLHLKKQKLCYDISDKDTTILNDISYNYESPGRALVMGKRRFCTEMSKKVKLVSL